MERERTKIDAGTSDQPRGGTRIDGGDKEPVKKKLHAQDRKITGILVTFTWRYQGALFPLYEGRNVIGSGDPSDIQITKATDPEMSADHALILCRAGRVELHDLCSTNGTFLNEKYVERDGADLTDGDAIRTGRTVFEFRKITSGGTGAQNISPQHAENDSGRKDETSI
jgi:pSer/pThr/pTyr-binding forkhead associated (FHA) protein